MWVFRAEWLERFPGKDMRCRGVGDGEIELNHGGLVKRRSRPGQFSQDALASDWELCPGQPPVPEDARYKSFIVPPKAVIHTDLKWSPQPSTMDEVRTLVARAGKLELVVEEVNVGTVVRTGDRWSAMMVDQVWDAPTCASALGIILTALLLHPNQQDEVPGEPPAAGQDVPDSQGVFGRSELMQAQPSEAGTEIPPRHRVSPGVEQFLREQAYRAAESQPAPGIPDEVSVSHVPSEVPPPGAGQEEGSLASMIDLINEAPSQIQEGN